MTNGKYEPADYTRGHTVIHALRAGGLCPSMYEPADIVIYIQGKGMVLKEKSLVAYDMQTSKILAIGTDAERMTGKESENVRVISPLRRGTVADYFVSVQMFTYLLEKAWGKRPLFKPHIAVCVSENLTEVERKALEDALFQSRAKDVMVISVPAGQFAALAETPEKLPRAYRKCKTMIAITKDEPEKYVTEELGQILQYGAENGISTERTADLLQKISEKIEEQPRESSDF